MEVEKIDRICTLLDIDHTTIKTSKIDMEKIMLCVIIVLLLLFIVMMTLGYLK